MSDPAAMAETRRLRALREARILDAAPSTAFDDFARLAAAVCSTPMAMVSLVDEQRQWAKARVGSLPGEMPRASSFCAEALAGDGDLFVVPDAALDPRFRENPLVLGAPGVRFYAAAPLRLGDGAVLGTLCVLDTRPRSLAENDAEALRLLARRAAGEIEALARVVSLQEKAAGLRHASRLRSYEKNVLTAISSGLPLASVLELAARGIEEVLGHGRASIMIVDRDACRLRYGAAPGLPEAFREAVRAEGVPIGPEAGSCGTAAFRRQAVVVEDIATDPLWRADRNFALSLGLRACWSTPVLGLDGRPLATFAIFDEEPRPVGLAEQENLDVAAHLVRLALEREERAATEAELTRRLAEQAALLDKAQDAIVVRTLDHVVLYWNRSAERLYGWTAAEALGRSVCELLYEQSEAFQVACASTLERGEWVGEIEQLTKSRERRVVEARWTLVRNEQGAPRSILAIDTDITERKRLERQFLRAQRMESLGTLAGGIAHDLNNVLAPITLGVELLSTAELSEDSRSILETIGKGARRGRDLVKQVLTFSRGVEGARVPVSVARIVREVQAIMEGSFPKNISLRCELPDEVLSVRGDATQLNQVLLNLCVNARDAMPGGGALVIRARRRELRAGDPRLGRDAKPGLYVTIEVEDGGSGMSAEVQERIFEPFFTTKPIGQGTGLGLSTVLGIVRSHGGFVNVYSEPGRGSRFLIHLPAVEVAESSSGPVESGEAGAPSGGGERVLLVDDEEPILDLARQILERSGYAVLAARNGEEALALHAASGGEVAVVVTDMMMPGMDGAELIAALRAVAPRLPIVAMSGLAANERLARGPGGADFFLAKPFASAALLRVLREALALRRGRDRRSEPDRDKLQGTRTF